MNGRHRYTVTVTACQYNDDGQYSSESLGSFQTWAASKAGAINNVRYRMGLPSILVDGAGGYMRRYEFRAVEDFPGTKK